MVDETKIVKSNTFEEWRQKTNEISFDVGGNSNLDDRFTDRLFTYNSVSDTAKNIVTGDDDTPSTAQTLQFEILPDSAIDNTGGYIILTHGATLHATIINGVEITQSGSSDFSGIVVSKTTVDGKPKILVKDTSGTFDASEDLVISATTVAPSATVVRLVTEAYNSGSIVVKNKVGATTTRINQGLGETEFHVPNVTLGIALDLTDSTATREAAVDILTEGTVVYQHTGQISGGVGAIQSAASFYGVVYHASPTHIYLKSHNGTFSSTQGLKVDGYGSGDNISTGLFPADNTTSYDTSLGNFIEFNNGVANASGVTISARDLVTAVNELQTDVGKIEDLTTSSADLTLSINELEDAVRGTGTQLSDYNLDTDSDQGLVGGVNELEAASRGNSSATNYNVTTESTEGFAGGINELDTAIRSATMQSSNALVSATLTTTANDITSAINEHDSELGNISSGHMLTTANNVGDAIREIEEQIGEEDISAIDAGDTDNTIYGALNQLHAELGNEDISAIDSGDSANTVSGALNQLHTEVGDVGGGLNGLAATNLTSAVDELRTDIGNVGNGGATLTTGTTLESTDLTAAVVELDSTVGSGIIGSGGDNTEAGGSASLTVAVNSLNTALGHPTSYNDGHYGANTVAGSLDLLQAGLLRNDDEIYNIMESINGDRPGTIQLTSLASIPSTFVAGEPVTQAGGFQATIAPNGINTTDKTITVRDITGTFNEDEELLVSGGGVGKIISNTRIVSMALVDNTISVAGLAADSVTGALFELAHTSIVPGDGLKGAGNLTQDRSIDIDLAVGGGLTFSVDDSSIIDVASTASWKGWNDVYLRNGTGIGAYQYGFSPMGTPSATLSTTVRNNQRFSFSSGNLVLQSNTALAADTLNDTAVPPNDISTTDGGTDGGAFVHIQTHLEDLNLEGRTVSLSGTVDSDSMHSRYVAEAFIKFLRKTQDENGDDVYNLGAESIVNLRTGLESDGSFSITLPIESNLLDQNVDIVPQLGFVVKGINAVAGEVEANGSIEISDLAASVTAAAGGGQLTVDTSVIRSASTITQTINSDLTLGTAKTLTIPNNSVLDVSAGTLLIGGGGEVLDFDTAFLRLSSGAATQGIRVQRDTDAMPDNTIQPNVEAELKWNEGQVELNSGHRGWQLTHLTAGATPVSETSDIVTFYNANELLENSTDISFSWDTNDENFSASLNGSGIVSNASWSAAEQTTGYVQYGTSDKVPQITVNSQGRITNVTEQDIQLAMTVDASSGNARNVDLRTDTLTIAGTTGEITTAVIASGQDTDDTIKIGLPDDVTISSGLTISGTTQATNTTSGALVVSGGVGIAENLHVGGNLIVEGTQTILNTETLTIDDNIIVLNDNKTGAPGSETAGIEVERGTGTNVQLRWNDSTDKWELTTDGTNYSEIITEATDYDDWVLASGTTGGTTTISDGNTVTFSAGTGLITSRSDKTITYAHSDTSTLSGQQGNDNDTGNSNNGKVLQSITVDGFGHVTDVADMNLDNRYMRSFQVEDGDGTEVTISQAKEWKFVEGTGSGATIDINWSDVSHGSNSDPYDLTFAVTNTDKGSAQQIFKHFEVQTSATGMSFSGTGTVSANDNDVTLKIIEGDGLNIDIDNSNKAIRFINDDRGSSQKIYKNIKIENQDGSEIETFTANINNDTITFKEVQHNSTAGIHLTDLGDDKIGIQHANTSSVSDLTSSNSGNTVISDLSLAFDTYGHVTGATVDTTTISVGNGTQTLSGGTSIGLTGDNTFTANQSGNSALTINHSDVTRTNGNNQSQTLSYGGTITSVIAVNTNAQGHVTGTTTKTFTLPADSNTEYAAGDGITLTDDTPGKFRISGSIIYVANLNDYQSTGIYLQTSDANATSGSNYPGNFAGILQVWNGYGTSGQNATPSSSVKFISQTYYRYNVSDAYIRFGYKSSNGTLNFTDWRDVTLNTWHSNTSSREGYVASGSGQAHKVWKTDAHGNPSWRADSDTTYSVQDGQLSQKNFTSTLKTKLDGIATGANAYVLPADQRKGNSQVQAGNNKSKIVYDDDGRMHFYTNNASHRITIENDGTLDILTNNLESDGKITGKMVKFLLNEVYPVGACYVALNNSNPNSLFGGTWTEQTGKFMTERGVNTNSVGSTSNGNNHSHNFNYYIPYNGYTGSQHRSALYEPYHNNSDGGRNNSYVSPTYAGRLIIGSGRNEQGEDLESIKHAGGVSNNSLLNLTNSRTINDQTTGNASHIPAMRQYRVWKRNVLYNG